MRVFDFDGTIYKGESLFDLYLFSVRYEPRVLKYIAPVAQCGIRYKTGHAELRTMERKLGRIIRRYLQDIDSSKRVARLNFRTNMAKRFREIYGPDAVIDEFYTDSYHDQSMIDLARTAYLVKGNRLIRIK